jgi:hypothetical protein
MRKTSTDTLLKTRQSKNKDTEKAGYVDRILKGEKPGPYFSRAPYRNHVNRIKVRSISAPALLRGSLYLPIQTGSEIFSMGRAISAAIREISSSSVGDGARLGDDVRSNSDRLISSILARAASGDSARPVIGRAGASINIARGCSALSLARFNARERKSKES